MRTINKAGLNKTKLDPNKQQKYPQNILTIYSPEINSFALCILGINNNHLWQLSENGF